MATDWEDVLQAYLHDPPNKALDIRGHETHATKLARIAIRQDIERKSLHDSTRSEDWLGSAAERVAMPTAGDNGERAVGVKNDLLTIYHTLSGKKDELVTRRLNYEQAEKELEHLVRGIDQPRQRFLALWRFWRDNLAMIEPAWAMLPAETRLPDHTIWNHLDIVAGLQPALAGNHGFAYLSFSLGPVQSFIASARSLRDLWTGSYLLSWLTFAAMRPILDDFGPAAFVFPALRGNPLMDRYLCELKQGLASQVGDLDPLRLLLPCLPNRFLAVVPAGPNAEQVRDIAARCEAACHDEWKKVCERVFKILVDKMPELDANGLWDRQVTSFFEVRTYVLPERECRDSVIRNLVDEKMWKRIENVRNLEQIIPEADRPKFRQDTAGLWMAQLDVLAKATEASRMVRHVPDYHPQGDVPQKCSLLGTYEQMGPANHAASREFWKKAWECVTICGTRIKKNERLCAVSLVKRFAWPCYLAKQLNLDSDDRQFADTSTVAAKKWLANGDKCQPIMWQNITKWSGQWLHWSKQDQDTDEDKVPDVLWTQIKNKREKDGKPPTYYAVLMIDGDDMGRWLRGEKGPKLEEVLHPETRDYIKQHLGWERPLKEKRLVGPALHASISEALGNFAVHFVPKIVKNHSGELIYAGGDDVLALLPTTTALNCARELSDAFRQNWADNRLLMGDKASVSAGMAIVHYKEDLRFALQTAREAEKAAKSAGKDALMLTVCRRSGEHASALVPWKHCETLQWLVDQYVQQPISDRWSYKLQAELTSLETLLPGFRAELRRLIAKLEADKELKLAFEAKVVRLFDEYHAEWKERKLEKVDADIMKNFVTLCQTASFLARGRDE